MGIYIWTFKKIPFIFLILSLIAISTVMNNNEKNPRNLKGKAGATDMDFYTMEQFSLLFPKEYQEKLPLFYVPLQFLQSWIAKQNSKFKGRQEQWKPRIFPFLSLVIFLGTDNKENQYLKDWNFENLGFSCKKVD